MEKEVTGMTATTAVTLIAVGPGMSHGSAAPRARETRKVELMAGASLSPSHLQEGEMITIGEEARMVIRTATNRSG